MREDIFYHVIASTSLLSEVEEEGQGQSGPSQGADDDSLDGEGGHGHGAGQTGYPDSQNEPGYPIEILVTF